jgi:thiamine-monophosphate kinase
VSSTPLGPGAEFDLIRRILQDAASPSSRVALAAGDDCALIDVGEGYLALTVDMSVEGVHFLAAWGERERAGRRAVLAAVSDLAAMAARPLGVLVSLSMPAEEGADAAERMGRSCRLATEEMGATLIGGDVSRGGTGLVIDVTVLGEVSDPLLRSGARPGDDLFLTGRLGAAAAAVRAWREDREPATAWVERFWNPQPRIREALWLCERGARAAIDLSDGLVADAAHVAAASGVAVELDWEAVPTADGVGTSLALSGGEDYELLAAVPAGILNGAGISDFERAFELPLTRVGRVVSGSGVRVFRDGEEVRVSASGFDHFRLEAEP